MAKQSGLGSNFYVGIYNLSGDVGAITNLDTMRGEQVVTGIDKSAPERILTLKDGAMSFASFWNVTAGQAEAVLSVLPRTDVITSAFIGTSVGAAAASMVAKQMNYAITRGQDGSLGATTDAKANGYGLEWGEILTTGVQSFATGSVSGSSIDLGSTSTLFGAAAYLHVFTMPSGTATFTIQDSADNVTFANVTGMGFTAVAGPTSERVQGAVNATVRRYVRVQGTGTHGTSTIAVNFVRYLVDPST